MGRHVSIGAAVGGAAALLFSSAVAMAQDSSPASEAVADDAYHAAIRAGTCEDPGDVNALLADLAPVGSADAESTSGGWLGPETQQPVRVSSAEIPLPMAEIASGDTAIVVEDVDGSPVACGIVGGQLIEETSLAVALLQVGESQASGIALLSSLGLDATRAQVFLVVHGDRIEPSAEGPEPEQSPSPGGGGGDIEPDPDDIAPDPESDIDPSEDIDVDVGDEMAP